MGDEVKVTVIAAGFDRLDGPAPVDRTKAPTSISELFAEDEPDVLTADDDDDDDFDVPSFLR
jgi:cell division protein FtsZ